MTELIKPVKIALPPFSAWLASNIPAVYDNTMSYYEELTSLIKYLETVVLPAVNTNGQAVAELQELYNQLKEYVENYFSSVDFQELVNNKLDEMATDGTLEAMLAEYIDGLGVNIKGFGAVGDGVTDDTDAINDAIQFCKTSGRGKLFIPDGTYKITDTLSIETSNLDIQGSGKSVLKYYGDGTEGNIIEIIGEDADNFYENITIDGITIDGTQQVYKGGYSMSTPKVTHTDPGYRGLVCIKCDFASNITVKNCSFIDVYGEGVICRYCSNVLISDNKLIDVSSGNIQQPGQTGWDNHGDGIATFFSLNVNIESNSVINHRVYLDGMSGAIGKPCGRSALEFEYDINHNADDATPDDISYNCPHYSDIPLQTIGSKDRRWGYALRMENNYCYGYTKGIHLESFVKCGVFNNTLLKNHIGIMASVANSSIFTGNYFNPLNVGPAPQGGYDRYYGGFAASEYSDSNIRKGVIVSNNVFEGDGNGVTLGHGDITISENRFNCNKGIYSVTSDGENINIVNNTFNSTLAPTFTLFLFLYNVKSANIINNLFYSETANRLDLTGEHYLIKDNKFVNTAIYHHSGNNYIDLINNEFTGSLYSNEVCRIEHADKSKIENNKFNITNFTRDYVVRLYNSTSDSVISNNKFNVTIDSESTSFNSVLRCETIEKCCIINNILFTDVVKFMRFYNIRMCVIKLNKTNNVLNTVINHTGDFAWGNIYERNTGVLEGSGIKPNGSLSSMANGYYQKGDRYYKYNVTDSMTSLGWCALSDGYYVTATWNSGTSYTANKLLKNASSNVYKCISTGSGASTVEPTHTTNTEVTETDGYKWLYVGPVVTFKELGL